MDNIVALENMQCELELQMINQSIESDFMCNMINMYESYFLGNINESYNIIYEETTKSSSSGISKIIESIGNFINVCVNKITDIFKKDKNKELLDELKKNESKISSTEKVDIYKSNRDIELLNEYIKEMVVLERKLMNLKFDYKISPLMKDGTYVTEYNDIIKEMDKLNNKFDKSFLDENSNIIKLAKKDAIRFNDKELSNVEVDYNAVKKESDRVLNIFKTDASGCKVPAKSNIIYKMSNAIGTRTRKVINRITTYKHKNIKVIILIASAVAGVRYVSKNDKAKQKIQQGVNKMNQYTQRLREENEQLSSRVNNKN